jgi:hypothetical protein
MSNHFGTRGARQKRRAERRKYQAEERKHQKEKDHHGPRTGPGSLKAETWIIANTILTNNGYADRVIIRYYDGVDRDINQTSTMKLARI